MMHSLWMVAQWQFGYEAVQLCSTWFQNFQTRVACARSIQSNFMVSEEIY